MNNSLSICLFLSQKPNPYQVCATVKRLYRRRCLFTTCLRKHLGELCGESFWTGLTATAAAPHESAWSDLSSLFSLLASISAAALTQSLMQEECRHFPKKLLKSNCLGNYLNFFPLELLYYCNQVPKRHIEEQISSSLRSNSRYCAKEISLRRTEL